MGFSPLVWVLLGYIAVREALYQYTSHKMLNKLMSRNFYEYQQAEALGKSSGIDSAPVLAPEDPHHAEDLGIFEGLG